MKLISIAYTDNDQGDPEPDSVTVEMSKDEALLLAVMVGGTNDLQRNEAMPGGGSVGSDIYDCLLSFFFQENPND